MPLNDDGNTEKLEGGAFSTPLSIISQLKKGSDLVRLRHFEVITNEPFSKEFSLPTFASGTT